ncbi:MAG: hypothetical protein M0Z53_08100 [Thermaerobacter sp.]|nr:hypothetical protein [Thermaerobacter sp.]
MQARGMTLTGAVVRAIATLAALGVWRTVFAAFPPLSLTTLATIGLLVAVIGYLADAMFDGHLSTDGRPLVGFVTAFGVVATYLSRFSSPLSHLYSFALYAVGTALVVAWGDWVYARMRQRSAS